jgi:hypothetical protein
LRTKRAVIQACGGVLIAVASTAGLSSAVQAAAPPALVLYPRAVGSADDVRALVDLRKKLRADGQFEVITYDPASSTMIRAAADAHHPEILKGPMTSDADRLTLARALGASFFVVVSKAAGRDKTDVHLVESLASARSWDVVGKKTDDAAVAVEQQAMAVLQHPAPAAPVPPLVPSPVPAPPVTPPAAPPVTPPAAPPVTPPAAPPVTPPAVVTPSPTPVPDKPATIVAPSPLPIPAPSTVKVTPTPPPVVPPVDDISGIRAKLQDGDAKLAQGNFVAAISLYRDAINEAPLSAVPRLKLAQTYLEADMRDKALDEAQRALQIAPGDASIQQFLIQIDAQSGKSDGAVARYKAQVTQDPQDAMAHVELGDAFWNNGELDQAEQEYKSGQSLAGVGTPPAQAASAHLARLYAAQQRYDDSLASLQQAGPGGYALALGIVQSRMATLSSTLDVAEDAFKAGTTTHADFYKTVEDVSTQAQQLADFVIKVTPPPAFKVSHLYRVQATHLLAQQSAVLVTYIETSDPAKEDQAAQLGKDAQTGMLTAHAAEQKLGLWGGSQAEAHN